MTHLQTVGLTRPLPASFEIMVADMLKCEQTAGQSVYEHGRSVSCHLQQLLSHLRDRNDLRDQWVIPKWFDEYREELAAHLHDESDVLLYALYHDCGKPYCQTEGEDGRSHFPDHAEVSRLVWSHVGGSDQVGRLIANDMVIHTASAEEINGKLASEWSCRDSVTLLLAALAELHSNAKMFGGLDSVNFKMKFKTVERRGKQILKHWFGQEGKGRLLRLQEAERPNGLVCCEAQLVAEDAHSFRKEQEKGRF